MSEWQPIETAPMDGTWILLRGRNAVWHPMIPVVAAFCPPGCNKGPGWFDGVAFARVDVLAVEWHPLPAST